MYRSRSMAILFLCLACSLRAQWPVGPETPLYIGNGIQPRVAVTSAGETYLAWLTDGDFQVWLQHLDRDGMPLWQTGGILISDHPNNSWIAIDHLNLAVDDSGNALLSCVDTRTGTWEVYAYKISPAGEFLWGPDGIPLSVDGGENISPRLTVLPGDNGVLVTWTRDYSKLRLQRIAADGTLQWGEDGLGIFDLFADLTHPQAILVAEDRFLLQYVRQTGSFPALTSELRLREYDLDGNAQWPAAVVGGPASFPLGNWDQMTVPDGLGGSWSAWTELTTDNQTARLNRLDGNGDLPWSTSLELSSAGTHFRTGPRLVPAPDGLATYAVWSESDASQTNRGIFAQRILSDETFVWAGSGAILAALGPDVYLDVQAAALAGDLLAAYLRQDTGNHYDVMASRVDAAGDFIWAGDIVAVSATATQKSDLAMDAAGAAAVFSWSENGSIYGMRLRSDGSLGGPVPNPGVVLDVPTEYGSIPAAVAAAGSGDTIRVAPGLYTGIVDFQGKDLVVTSRWLFDGDTLHIQNTILDGGEQDAVVLLQSGESRDARLCGFTIQNGLGHTADPDGDGDSSDYGAGIFLLDASPRLDHLIIQDNAVTAGGGGGLFASGSQAVLEDITFLGNSSADVGGGLYARANSDLELRRVTFLGNSCADVGAALYARDNSDLKLERVLAAGNTSQHAGGALGFKNDCHPTLVFVTLTGNSAVHYGGSIYCNHSFPVVVNSILWNNAGGEVYFATFGDPSRIVLAYTDVQGGLEGVTTSGNGELIWEAGNLDQDPLFLDPGMENYRLREFSSLLDAGTTAFVWEGDTLPENPPQYLDLSPDPGRFESRKFTGDPFPMPLHGQWTLASDRDTITLQVNDSLQAGDQGYALFPAWYPGEGSIPLRSDSTRVWALGDSGEVLLYDFRAPLGAAWWLQNVFTWESEMSLLYAAIPVVTPLDSFPDCLVFGREIGADFAYRDYIAPGRGLVQRDYITIAGVESYQLIAEGVVVSNQAENGSVPSDFTLFPGTPNPFNPTTILKFVLPDRMQVDLTLHDLRGRKIAQPLQGISLEPGEHRFVLDASTWPAGIYLATLRGGGFSRTVKLTLLR